jgi:hypothetical protein
MWILEYYEVVYAVAAERPLIRSPLAIGTLGHDRTCLVLAMYRPEVEVGAVQLYMRDGGYDMHSTQRAHIL